MELVDTLIQRNPELANMSVAAQPAAAAATQGFANTFKQYLDAVRTVMPAQLAPVQLAPVTPKVAVSGAPTWLTAAASALQSIPKPRQSYIDILAGLPAEGVPTVLAALQAEDRAQNADQQTRMAQQQFAATQQMQGVNQQIAQERLALDRAQTQKALNAPDPLTSTMYNAALQAAVSEDIATRRAQEAIDKEKAIASFKNDLEQRDPMFAAKLDQMKAMTNYYNNMGGGGVGGSSAGGAGGGMANLSRLANVVATMGYSPEQAVQLAEQFGIKVPKPELTKQGQYEARKDAELITSLIRSGDTVENALAKLQDVKQARGQADGSSEAGPNTADLTFEQLQKIANGGKSKGK